MKAMKTYNEILKDRDETKDVDYKIGDLARVKKGYCFEGELFRVLKVHRQPWDGQQVVMIDKLASDFVTTVFSFKLEKAATKIK